jgi:hypothetical protein
MKYTRAIILLILICFIAKGYSQTGKVNGDISTKGDKKIEYLFDGGIGFATVAGAGMLFFFFKSRKKRLTDKPVIMNLYPNPSNGVIFLDYYSTPGMLIIVNMSGQIVKKMPVREGSKGFDLTDLSNGNYLASIQAGDNQSNTMPFIIQR